MKKITQISFEPEQRTRMRQVAFEQDRSIASIVREAVEEYLQKVEAPSPKPRLKKDGDGGT